MARRLILPYLFAATSFALIHTLMGGAWAVPWNEWWTVYLTGYSQFWFIQSILILFVVVGLFDAVFGSDKPWPTLALFGIACAAFLTPIADGVNILSLDRAFYLAPFFLGGVLINRLGDRLPRYAGYVIAALAAIGLILHAIDTFAEPGLTTDRRTLTGLFLALGLSTSFVVFRFRQAILERIGGYSYTIYLYHVFAVTGLQFAYDVIARPGPYIGLVLGVGLGIGLPIIAHELARFVGRWLPWLPVLTLGVKGKPVAIAQTDEDQPWSGSSSDGAVNT